MNLIVQLWFERFKKYETYIVLRFELFAKRSKQTRHGFQLHNQSYAFKHLITYCTPNKVSGPTFQSAFCNRKWTVCIGFKQLIPNRRFRLLLFSTTLLLQSDAFRRRSSPATIRIRHLHRVAYVSPRLINTILSLMLLLLNFKTRISSYTTTKR